MLPHGNLLHGTKFDWHCVRSPFRACSEQSKHDLASWRHSVQGCPNGDVGPHSIRVLAAPMDAGNVQPCGITKLLPVGGSLHSGGLRKRLSGARTLASHQTVSCTSPPSATAAGLLWQQPQHYAYAGTDHHVEHLQRYHIRGRPHTKRDRLSCLRPCGS